MNRNHLALFHAVAQAGSISGGAAAARVSQPAVSKQIAELEESLGVRLLERLPRGARLTEAGNILADYARRWRFVEDEAERAIEEYRGLKRGRLAVGASLTIGGYLLPELLAQFSRRFPHIELKVQIANTEEIQKALVDGAIEFGLTEGVIESEELESAIFLQDELVPIAAGGHPLLKKRSVTPEAVCREPFIMREEGSGTRAVLEQALRQRKLEVSPVLSLASPEAIKNAVAAGMGIAVVSRLIIELELRAGLLGIIPVEELKIRRPLHFQQVKGRSQSPAVGGFREMLDEWVRRRGVGGGTH